MKNLVFPDEVRAKVRKDMADVYKAIRSDNPAMARLLFKRSKVCEDSLRNMINKELYIESNVQ